MTFCRFDGDRYGVVERDCIQDVTSVVREAIGPFDLPLPNFDPVIAAFADLSPRIANAAKAAPRVSASSARFAPPVARPGKIVAAPVNYTKHLQEVRLADDLHHGNATHMAEIRNAGLFLKATSSLMGVSDAVHIRFSKAKRPRSRARGRHRKDGQSRQRSRCPRLCCRIFDRSGYDLERPGRSQFSEVDRLIYRAGSMARDSR